ncbi:MAG: hypothetical protein KGL97_09340, partial [Alphaproteobacteria bacterium]|nr:hypothetical protein [Alphaproteobacteria bacterium]
MTISVQRFLNFTITYRSIFLLQRTLKSITLYLSRYGSISLRDHELTDFLFRGLMFEAEAANFQSAGIQVGADTQEAEKSLLTEALAPFPVRRRNQALE